jgi:anti-anti-sigma factor
VSVQRTNPIEVSWHDTDIAILTLRGEHDMATADQLAGELRRLIRVGEQVIVDLSVVEFIDSSVLNALCTADRLAAERGSTFTLQIGSASGVRKVLEVSGILDQLSWAGSRDEAIRAARRPGAREELRARLRALPDEAAA